MFRAPFAHASIRLAYFSPGVDTCYKLEIASLSQEYQGITISVRLFIADTPADIIGRQRIVVPNTDGEFWPAVILGEA